MPIIMLGEPFLGSEQEGQPPAPKITPLGQLSTMLPIWDANPSEAKIVARLREEYLAIAFAMKVTMGIDFRAAHIVGTEDFDLVATNALLAMGCRLVGFTQGIDRELTCFPCDFGVELPGISLISRRCAESVSSVTKGCLTAVSPYGEGGRVLHAGKCVVVADFIIASHMREPADTEVFEQVGLSAGLFPPPLAGAVEGEDILISANDHLDRVGAMILGKDGLPHVIMDNPYWSGRAGDQVPPQRSHEIAHRICDRIGATYHVPKEAMQVPYSLNLRQFPDGRVLMTSGDEPMAELVAGIVGSDKLILTQVPIRYFPAYRGAGIRCLTGLVPEVFFKRM